MRIQGQILGGTIPLPDAELAMFLWLVDGSSGVVTQRTGPGGKLDLELPTGAVPYALLVTPAAGFWEMLVAMPEDGLRVVCPALELPPASDWWHRDLGVGQDVPSRGRGIRIGVVDTGCGPHPALRHVRTLGRFLRGSFYDQARQDARRHGTHVCGILTMRSGEGHPYSGIAPGASVFCVGVVGEEPTGGANQLDIAEAVELLSRDHAVDLINISLGCKTKSAALEDAILDARDRGALCICAAGNDGAPVVYPAALDAALAVSAIGRKDWGPPGSLASARLPAEGERCGEAFYLANFSAFGSEVFCAGPGVGIISAVPSTEDESPRYQVMDGTSMASPAVCGALAISLARSQTYQESPRGPKRAELARAMLREICRDIGLPIECQGMGLPLLPAGDP